MGGTKGVTLGGQGGGWYFGVVFGVYFCPISALFYLIHYFSPIQPYSSPQLAERLLRPLAWHPGIVWERSSSPSEALRSGSHRPGHLCAALALLAAASRRCLLPHSRRRGDRRPQEARSEAPAPVAARSRPTAHSLRAPSRPKREVPRSEVAPRPFGPFFGHPRPLGEAGTREREARSGEAKLLRDTPGPSLVTPRSFRIHTK